MQAALKWKLEKKKKKTTLEELEKTDLISSWWLWIFHTVQWVSERVLSAKLVREFSQRTKEHLMTGEREEEETANDCYIIIPVYCNTGLIFIPVTNNTVISELTPRTWRHRRLVKNRYQNWEIWPSELQKWIPNSNKLKWPFKQRYIL